MNVMEWIEMKEKKKSKKKEKQKRKVKNCVLQEMCMSETCSEEIKLLNSAFHSMIIRIIIYLLGIVLYVYVDL